MTIYYSAKNNGFYPSELKDQYKASAGGWPSDATEITQSDYDTLMQSRGGGKIITSDSTGKPVLSDPVIDWWSLAESQRLSLLTEANTTISLWQTKLLAGKTLTDSQRTKLDSWLVYMDALESLDFTGVTNEAGYNAITWPDKPE